MRKKKAKMAWHFVAEFFLGTATFTPAVLSQDCRKSSVIREKMVEDERPFMDVAETE